MRDFLEFCIGITLTLAIDVWLKQDRVNQRLNEIQFKQKKVIDQLDEIQESVNELNEDDS